jgi:hypothetical protein
MKKKIIKFEELKRLSFCNSKDLPRKVNVGGKLYEWVGIGWIEIGKANKRYTTAVK